MAVSYPRPHPLPSSFNSVSDHSNPHAKKKVYDFVHKQAPGVAPFASPYHAMLEALDRVANLRVTGLLIEVTERAVY